MHRRRREAGRWWPGSRKSFTASSDRSDPRCRQQSAVVAGGRDDAISPSGRLRRRTHRSTRTSRARPSRPGRPRSRCRCWTEAAALIASSTAPVTLEVSPSPSGGASGTGPANASGGVATFAWFRIHTSGLGIRRRGEHDGGGDRGFQAGQPLGIWDFGITCPRAVQCVSPPSWSGTTTGQLTVDEGASSRLDVARRRGPRLPDYMEVSSVLTFASTGGGLKTITITIPRSVGGRDPEASGLLQLAGRLRRPVRRARAARTSRGSCPCCTARRAGPMRRQQGVRGDQDGDRLPGAGRATRGVGPRTPRASTVSGRVRPA